MQVSSANLRQALSSRYAREPLLILLAYVPYFLARGHAVSHAETAFENSYDVIRLERSLGLFRELSVQSAALSYEALVHAFNLIYFYGHWPVIIAIGLYLFIRHPRVYAITRNAFLLSGAVALLLYALFPVAPPRLTPGFIDTLSMTVPVSFDQSRLVNPYAAIPSLHVGWDVLIALGLFVATRRWPVRTIALTLPPLMLVATVVTGNHFFVDGIAGALLALAAFALAAALHRRWPRVRARPVA
ncbi:MAG TPA: phosphatase PAP2 family protein [Dehalococcoidia bacterium]|nr:phosphatase PAP2 family protein [Dehalococcoidia bacterium]